MADVEVWLDWHYGKQHGYSVVVDGKPYDHFVSNRGPLTYSEQRDVASGYREALDADG
jgi:hypothetical protein